MIACVQTENRELSEARVQFGREIRTAREANWPTRPEFRKAFGIPEPTMVKVERGDPVRLETLARAARALGLDVPDVIASGLSRVPAPPARDSTDDLSSWLRAELVSAEALAARRHAEVMQALGDLVHTLGAQSDRGR